MTPARKGRAPPFFPLFLFRRARACFFFTRVYKGEIDSRGCLRERRFFRVSGIRMIYIRVLGGWQFLLWELV